MTAPVTGWSLPEAVAELQSLMPEQRATLQELADQWRERRVRVVLLGEAKRGKSSLVNALLDRRVLPTGVVPVTSVVTEVTAGDRDEARVCFAGGQERTVGLAELGCYVAEEANPGNHKGVSRVLVTVTTSTWPASVVLVDTPGTGAVEGGHEDAARAAVGAMDVAVLVLTVDPPISARERDLLLDAEAHAAATFVALNKTDLLTGEEVEEALAYTRRVVSGSAGAAVEVLGLSSRDPAAPETSGLGPLRRSVVGVAERDAATTLLRSLPRRLGAVVDTELARLDVEIALLDAEASAAVQRATAFGEALRRARQQVRDCVGVVEASVRDLDADLDLSSRQRVARLTAELRAGLPREPDRDCESTALAELLAASTDAAEEWRRACARWLEHRLEDVANRTTGLAESVVADVRGAAAELLGVDLGVAVPVLGLPEDDGFFYVTRDLVDATSAISAGARRRLPGSPGRRALHRHLRSRAASYADRQVGRARGDLRGRLAGARRTLTAQVQSSVGDLVDRLEQSSRVAIGRVEASEQRRGDVVAPLRGRRERLRTVSRSL